MSAQRITPDRPERRQGHDRRRADDATARTRALTLELPDLELVAWSLTTAAPQVPDGRADDLDRLALAVMLARRSLGDPAAHLALCQLRNP